MYARVDSVDDQFNCSLQCLAYFAIFNVSISVVYYNNPSYAHIFLQRNSPNIVTVGFYSKLILNEWKVVNSDPGIIPKNEKQILNTVTSLCQNDALG